MSSVIDIAEINTNFEGFELTIEPMNTIAKNPNSPNWRITIKNTSILYFIGVRNIKLMTQLDYINRKELTKVNIFHGFCTPSSFEVRFEVR